MENNIHTRTQSLENFNIVFNLDDSEQTQKSKKEN